MKSLEEKIKEIEALNVTFISENNGIMRLKCVNGHEFEKKYPDLMKTHGYCHECKESYFIYVKRINKLKELNLEYVSHSGTLYTVKCENDHVFEKDYHTMLQKNGACEECDGSKNTNTKRLNKLKALGYKILSMGKYNVKLKCEKGHIFEENLFYFTKSKSACPVCKKRN